MEKQHTEPAMQKPTHRLRGIPALGCLVGFQLGTFLGLFGVLLGGTQGPVENGSYFLVSHGVLSEVPERLWHWMGLVELVSIVGLVFGAVSMGVAVFAQIKRWTWYYRQKDYTWPTMVGCITSMLWLAAAVWFQG